MLTIIRNKPEKDGTFGTLAINGTLQCFSLELPWQDNETSISCIPEGVFPVFFREKWRRADTYGPTYEIIVPNRSAILFHPANIIDELRGCVALGEKLGHYKQRKAIMNSANAFNAFMSRMGKTKSTSLQVLRVLY